MKTFLVISCASKDDSDYDYTYDYTVDEESYINDVEPVATENFLANIEPIELESLFFLKKSGKKVKPREVTKVGLIPRTNAVEFHFRDGSNDIAVILWQGIQQGIEQKPLRNGISRNTTTSKAHPCRIISKSSNISR